ncbi:MAG: corrinoid ABC transporter substrate-binding protein [Chloroflexi bacterium ADurb.Bin180]|nr:MAG: corrinoid ABC transporter substrate-binding protein [Chloroflexi bacterium ADurb.Bin180]
MDRRRMLRWMLAVLLLGVLAQACRPEPTPTPVPTPTPRPTATPTPLPPPTPTPVPTPESIKITDSLGNTVEFKTLPQHIVIAGKNPLPVVENLFLYPEANERLAGYAMGGKQNPATFLSLMHPTFKDKPTLQTGATAEQITALQPDAVVMKSLNYEALGKPLQALGIPVIALDLETPEQFTHDHVILGELFGNPTRSQDILAYYEAKLAPVAQATEGLKPEEKPTVLLMQYSLSGGEVAVSVPPGSWLQTLMVELSGGNPVWKDTVSGSGWAVVNLEQIAAWDPEVMLVVDYTANPKEAVAKLKADARWQELKAVKENRIYGFAGDFFSWDQPDPRWILGVNWLAAKLHPEKFPGFDLTQMVTEFFVQMYGMSESQVQSGVLPKLTGDVK